MSFKNRNALITGACGGLGKAIAEAFLFEGANVVVCDIRDGLIEDFKANVSPAYPECTLVLKCDVTNDSELDEMFAQAEKTFGPLNFVVNCAGMMDRFDAVGDMERSMWDQVIALNLTAPAMVSQRAIKMMIKNDIKGSIVNIASIAGVRGFTCGAAYTTSKHGLIGLTKNTAAFYGPKAGIRCNAILPGAMQTNIFQNFGRDLNKEGYEMLQKSYPQEYVPQIDLGDVGKLVVHICSDAGKLMNGSLVAADGGAIAH